MTLSCDSQVNESGSSHIRRDKLGCCGDSGEQKCEISGRCHSKTEVVTQDVPMGTDDVIPCLYRGSYPNANLVTVMISVVIPRSSAMARGAEVRERQVIEGWWVFLAWGSRC